MRSRLAAILLVLTSVSHAQSAPADSRDATAVVERFQADLLAVMKESARLDVRQRYERLREPLATAFHLPVMVQIATGHHWKAARADQQKRLIESFHRMSAATLATLFDSYSDESFEIVGEMPGPQGTRIVVTNLVKKDKSKVKLSYAAKSYGSRWWLIDVVVDDGISELTVRISEYRRALAAGGAEALIVTLDGKADELLGGQ